MEHMSSIDVQQLSTTAVENYTKLQRKFQKACSQVILLNNKIVDANIRYNRANQQGNKVFLYSGRLRLMTLEGVRNTIYEYAARLADVIDEEQDKLVAMGLMQEEYQPMETA